MEAKATKTAVILKLSPTEALAIAAFLGRIPNRDAMDALGLTGGEYDELANALEYGPNAPYPFGWNDGGTEPGTDNYGTGIYGRMARVAMTVAP